MVGSVWEESGPLCKITCLIVHGQIKSRQWQSASTAAISDVVMHPFIEAVFPQARQEGRDALDAAATLSEERHCRRLERVDFEAAAPK